MSVSDGPLYMFDIWFVYKLSSFCQYQIKALNIVLNLGSFNVIFFPNLKRAHFMIQFFRVGREPERRHSSYYPNLSSSVSRTPSHGSDYVKFRNAMQIIVSSVQIGDWAATLIPLIRHFINHFRHTLTLMAVLPGALNNIARKL